MEALLRILDLPGLMGAAQMGGLLFLRLLPLVAFTPVFGGPALPQRLRMGLTLVLTAALLPAFAVDFAQQIAWHRYAALAAKEALVGFTLAFFVLILFETLATFGALVDLARGATIANVLDPLTQQQQSILATFFTQLAVVLFLTLGGHRLLLAAVGRSFALLRPVDLLPAALWGPAATGELIALVAELFLIAIQLAAPVIVVLFLLDFALGIMNRVAPQMEVFFFSMTIKGGLGLLLILLSFAFLLEQFTAQFAHFLELLQQWVTRAAM